jgi:hypothetical protein
MPAGLQLVLDLVDQILKAGKGQQDFGARITDLADQLLGFVSWHRENRH